MLGCLQAFQREYSEAKMAHAEQFLKIVNDAKKRVKEALARKRNRKKVRKEI